jgi:hypothetical protein
MIVRATNEETLLKKRATLKFEKKWPDRISDEKTSKVNPIATGSGRWVSFFDNQNFYKGCFEGRGPAGTAIRNIKFVVK